MTRVAKSPLPKLPFSYNGHQYILTAVDLKVSFLSSYLEFEIYREDRYIQDQKSVRVSLLTGVHQKPSCQIKRRSLQSTLPRRLLTSFTTRNTCCISARPRVQSTLLLDR